MPQLELYDLTRLFDEMKIRGKPSPIIANEQQRLTASILYPLRRISCILTGEAGSAKTTIIKAMLVGIWGEDVLEDGVDEVVMVSAASAKGFLTDAMMERINERAGFLCITELQNVMKGDGSSMAELIKAFAEGEPYIYQRNDMTSGTTKKMSLRALPLLTSKADENKQMPELGEEMERRLFNITTESSIELNKKVHKRKAECAVMPDEVIYTGGLSKAKVVRAHFKDCIHKRFAADDYLVGVIKNPGAVHMSHVVSPKFTISNTTVGYWNELVFGVTHFYYKDRLFASKGPVKYLLSTPADNYMAWEIGGKAMLYASLRVREVGQTVLEMLPVRSYESYGSLRNSNTKESMSLDEIVDLLQTKGIIRSKVQVKGILTKLEFSCYCSSDGKENYWRSYDHKGDFLQANNWGALVEECKAQVRTYYPEVADDYIARFCEDPACIHPITGAKVKLLDLDPSVAEVKPSLTKKAISLEDL